MGLGDLLKGTGLESFNTSSIIDKLYFYIGIFLFFAVLAGIIGGYFYVKKRGKTVGDRKTIIWWAESASSKLEQREVQTAEEITIPGSRLKLFYDKKKDEWIPRFSREIKPNSYYGLRTPSGNIVNFGMKGLSENFKDADLEFDHTDMLWAAENAREFIKRNYKDKSKKWWQEYQGAITTAIYILILTFSFVIIIYFMRGMVQDLGTVAGSMKEAADACLAPRSGLAPV